jgi:hypothetical protein
MGTAWQSLNLFIEYDLAILDVPVQPVASEGIRIICPQAVVHLCTCGTCAGSLACCSLLGMSYRWWSWLVLAGRLILWLSPGISLI